MIKLCLDENISPNLAGSLRGVFRRLSFTSVSAEGFTGLQDTELFEALASRNIGGLITCDKMQLIHDVERQGLRESNLHWIGLPTPDEKGYRQQAMISTTIINGLRAIIDQGFADTPHMYRLPCATYPNPGLVAVQAL